jgi:hypothetical protein
MDNNFQITTDDTLGGGFLARSDIIIFRFFRHNFSVQQITHRPPHNIGRQAINQMR